MSNRMMVVAIATIMVGMSLKMSADDQRKSQQSQGNDRGVEQPVAWGTELVAAIQQHWVRPTPTPVSGKRIVLNIGIDRTGAVQSVSIESGSGNPAIDRSCLMAVIAASPLPLPRDPSVFQSSFKLTYIPR